MAEARKDPGKKQNLKQKTGNVSSGKKSYGGKFCSFMLFGISLIVGLSAVVVYYLPSPIDPVPYVFSESGEGSPPLTGVYVVHNELQRAKRMFEGDFIGPESFSSDKDGYIYTGLIDGRIVKVDPRADSYTLLTRMGEPPYTDCGKEEMFPICGRPLGMEIDSKGDLIVVDSYKGLFRINTQTGEKARLFQPTESGELACPLLNNLAVLNNDSIFLTCSSRFPLNNHIYDTVEGRPNGKVFHYNPIAGCTTVVRQNMYWVNGIAKSSGEDFLIISELIRARILRYYLKGPKVGQWDVFVDNLPALVDNITPTRQTPGFWAAGVVTRAESLLDFTADKPWIRLLFSKLGLLKALDRFSPKRTLVMMINEEGSVVKTLHDDTGKTVTRISEAYEFEGELFLGSYIAPFLARVEI